MNIGIERCQYCFTSLQVGFDVFPYYIVHGLPTGLTGLVIASLFAAGMSTISTSINSAATIVLTDFYKKSHRGPSSPRREMAVLYGASSAVGGIGVVVGLMMMQIDGVLDAWWKLASIFSGGMLGLFLLGLVCHKVKRTNAVIAVAAGLAVIAWMSFWAPLHTYLTIVLGTTAIFLTGFVLTKVSK